MHSELAEGVTWEGEKFLVPRTADTLEAFIHPKHANAVVLFTLIPFIFWSYFYYYVRPPIYVNVIHFFITRMCYNGGLGYLLHIQSRYRSITKWYKRVTSQPDSLLARFVLYITRVNLPPGKTTAEYPAAFNAWILYKAIVNVVLSTDSSAYFFLTVRCFNVPKEFDWISILMYLAGALLFAFFWWAKVDAHRCIGTYCWYWGDFFYRKNVSLTFDGIFELFPHPMYTVGYAIYYGNSLICHSYTLLLCSIAAHMSQLVFLVLVEEPHIKRTYGGDMEQLDSTRAKLLYDEKDGWFPSRADLAYFFKFDPYNSGFWALFMGVVYVVAVALLAPSSTWAILQAVVWRVVHWGGIGYILWQQSVRQLWTRAYMSRGRSLHEAFDHWKRIYHLSTTINVVAFTAMTVRLMMETMDITSILSISYLAKFAVACALFFISAWTSWSTYVSIGDFGWFYGDFFIGKDRYQHRLCYTGIYRFLNNPDAMTGYAGLYGLALVSQSWTVFGLAAMAQAMNMIFVNAVEVPHMRKLYEEEEHLRAEGPLGKKIKQLIRLPDEVKDKNERLVREVRRVRTKAIVEMYGVYKKLKALRKKEKENAAASGENNGDETPSSPILGPMNASRKGSMNKSSNTSSSSNSTSSNNNNKYKGNSNSNKSPSNGIILSAPSICRIGEPLTVSYTAPEGHSDTDWIGVYAVDVPSAPLVSDGKWLYVPPESSGTITIKPWLLPRVDGVYEVRYHTNNTYDVARTKVVVFTSEADSTDLQLQLDAAAE